MLARILIAAGAIFVLFGARAAEAGGCRGYLELKAGPGVKTAPNARLLLVGFTFDTPKAAVTGGGKSIPSRTETWGAEEGRCGNRTFVVRPETGDWPKGATLSVDLGSYGKVDAAIGDTPDTTPPTAKAFARGPYTGHAPDGRVVTWQGVRDGTSPAVLLQVLWADRPSEGMELRVIAGEEPGRFEYFVGSKGCDAVVLLDTAGNARRFPELCKP